MSASPPSWYRSHWRRKAQTIASSLREKEKSGETYVQNYGFWRDYARDWFLPCLTQSMDETGTVWMPRDHERQKRAQQLLKVQYILWQTETGTAHRDWEKMPSQWFLT